MTVFVEQSLAKPGLLITQQTDLLLIKTIKFLVPLIALEPSKLEVFKTVITAFFDS